MGGGGGTFGIEMKTTFLHSRSSLDNRIRFQACVQWRIQGEGPGGPDPLSYQTWRLIV